MLRESSQGLDLTCPGETWKGHMLYDCRLKTLLLAGAGGGDIGCGWRVCGYGWRVTSGVGGGCAGVGRG
jgi:hypothetical protein